MLLAEPIMLYSMNSCVYLERADHACDIVFYLSDNHHEYIPYQYYSPFTLRTPGSPLRINGEQGLSLSNIIR